MHIPRPICTALLASAASRGWVKRFWSYFLENYLLQRNSPSKVEAVHVSTMNSYLRGLHLITSCHQYLGPPQELVEVRGEEEESAAAAREAKVCERKKL